MMTPEHKIQHAVCTTKEDKGYFEFLLLCQAKRDYKHSKINALFLHKNMHPILVLVTVFLGAYGKDQIVSGVLIKPYYYFFLALILLHPLYASLIDRKIKRKLQAEIEGYAYFLTTGTIKKIISHRPKDNIIEFEIEYLNQKSQIQTRIFKHFYTSDIYNPDDFKDRESSINALINQTVTLYLSAESETLIKLYLTNSAESSVRFKKGRFFHNKNRWWYFHCEPLLSPVFLHPDDLRKIYLHYSTQDQNWYYTFQGEVFENVTLHNHIINIDDFELALSQTLPSFDHAQYQAIKASHPEQPQLIWEHTNPLSYAEKKQLRKKLASKLSLYATVLSIFTATIILSTTPFKVFDDILLNILVGILITAVIALAFIYWFYAICRRRHYLATDEQVALFQIQPRKKGAHQ
ncbi:hypothetical protein [Acinetobacter sp. YH12140]|uniref:hypothetical protein n=1 Tax=Acinetobacter sp. YH12140 TaxID=2601124 RepID=UPI0015D437B4|nr:hypothetical protein [Acinetobacter sp. YH12140]